MGLTRPYICDIHMVLNNHGACVTSMGLTSLNGAHNNGL